MPTRKQVRDQVKTQIESAYTGNGEVYAGRILHTAGMKEFVDVFFEEGEHEQDGLQTYVQALFVIGVHKTGIVTDDELDDIGTECEQGLFADTTLGGIVHGITEAGFEYMPRGDSQYDVLYLRYLITYDQ
jgi:hypothetical protein